MCVCVFVCACVCVCVRVSVCGMCVIIPFDMLLCDTLWNIVELLVSLQNIVSFIGLFCKRDL